MDIIVTTPKSQMTNAAKEAADCIAAGGGEYFRRFAPSMEPKHCRRGDRVYYVEDGFIRGFAIVSLKLLAYECQQCDTTGRQWPPGIYLFMHADSWRWIRPIPMRGFQGFRYASRSCGDATPDEQIVIGGLRAGRLEIIGGWRDPKPEVRP